MVPRFLMAVLCAGLFSGAAPPSTCDMTGYRPQPGLEASSQDGSLSVRWDGEKGQELLARFATLNGIPTILELAVRKKGGAWVTVGRDLVPEFKVTTGGQILLARPSGGMHSEQDEPMPLSCSTDSIEHSRREDPSARGKRP